MSPRVPGCATSVSRPEESAPSAQSMRSTLQRQRNGTRYWALFISMSAGHAFANGLPRRRTRVASAKSMRVIQEMYSLRYRALWISGSASLTPKDGGPRVASAQSMRATRDSLRYPALWISMSAGHAPINGRPTITFARSMRSIREGSTRYRALAISMSAGSAPSTGRARRQQSEPRDIDSRMLSLTVT